MSSENVIKDWIEIAADAVQLNVFSDGLFLLLCDQLAILAEKHGIDSTMVTRAGRAYGWGVLLTSGYASEIIDGSYAAFMTPKELKNSMPKLVKI